MGLADYPPRCGQLDPWTDRIHPCIRFLGHDHVHRDEWGHTWKTQDGGSSGGASELAGAGPGSMAPPPPPAPTAVGELELRAELARERQAHAETRAFLDRALRMAQHYRLKGEG